MTEHTRTAPETLVTAAVAKIVATYQRIVSDDERAKITATVRAVYDAAHAAGREDAATAEGQDEHLVGGEPR